VLVTTGGTTATRSRQEPAPSAAGSFECARTALPPGEYPVRVDAACRSFAGSEPIGLPGMALIDPGRSPSSYSTCDT